MRNRIQNRKWYPYAVALCIAVLFYVLLTNFRGILDLFFSFLGFFTPLLIGCAIAYVLNPLAKLFQNRVLKGIRKESLCWALSVLCSILTVLALLGLLLGLLIPQLITSISILVRNMSGYFNSLTHLLGQWGLLDVINLEKLLGSSMDITEQLMNVLRDNLNNIVSVSMSAGQSVFNLIISCIFSVYLLLSKKSLLRGFHRLFRALLPETSYQSMVRFLTRCNDILINYVIYSLLDVILVGIINAVFMFIMQMEYVGLISIVVAIFYLIPPFGAVIGYLLGSFILLLVNPIHALIFLIFSFILQFLEGNVIKPRLMGDSLGVSGVLILAGIVVFGNMFGILGMLLAIPIVAILDFVYKEALLPALEHRRHRLDKESLEASESKKAGEAQ